MNLNQTKREYFTNIHYNVNSLIPWNETSLRIPKGFTGKLLPTDRQNLMNDQLLTRGLTLDTMVYCSHGRISSHILRATGQELPIEKKTISHTLKDYLEKYCADESLHQNENTTKTA